MKKIRLSIFLLFTLTASVYGDVPTYDATWQWNRNVTIDRFYAYWDTSSTKIVLSNGEVCYVNKEDKELFSIALAMHAQKSSGQFICQRDPVTNFEGKHARRAHRIMVE